MNSSPQKQAVPGVSTEISPKDFVCPKDMPISASLFSDGQGEVPPNSVFRFSSLLLQEAIVIFHRKTNRKLSMAEADEALSNLVSYFEALMPMN